MNVKLGVYLLTKVLDDSSIAWNSNSCWEWDIQDGVRLSSPIIVFFRKMMKMHKTKIKFSIDLLIKVSNMSISSVICNYCEDQDIQDGVL